MVRTLVAGDSAEGDGSTRGDDVRRRGMRTAERTPVEWVRLLPEVLPNQKLADSELIRASEQQRPLPLAAGGSGGA